jgi:hypothetical protein
LLFPRTDIDLQEYQFEAIQRIDVRKNRCLSVLAAASVLIFELNYNMALQDIIFTDAFIQKHRKALSGGKISGEINDQYKDSLKKGRLYRDGQGWTTKATFNLHWKEIKNISSSSK